MADDCLLALTSQIVAAYVERNQLSPGELPDMIGKVHGALATAGAPTPEAEERQSLTPAQIRKSVTPDGLISFEDGKPYKQLKRHLTSRGMTLETYRAKWGLPRDYPSVAPAYSAMRSQLAKAAGLGMRVGPKTRKSR